jgi:hypothetical protein
VKVTILHTPADASQPGLLLHLQQILAKGAIEVGALVLSEVGLPLPRYTGGRISSHGEELRAELRRQFEELAPDVIVLSDRLNGSKLVARSLASEMGIGVLVLKESVFPSRVFFAPESRALENETVEEDEDAIVAIEEYQKFRLDKTIREAFRFSDESGGRALPAFGGRRCGLVIIDHSGCDSDGRALDRTWALVEEAKRRGYPLVLCERWRDVCSDRADCGRYVVLFEGSVSRRLPCRENQLCRLISECDWCATNGSLHALGALYLGKPVVATDRCVYSGRGFTIDLASRYDCGEAMDMISKGPRADEAQKEKLQRFLYRFLFNDLLAVDERKRRFCEASEQRVLDALFRALPLERGARVLPGAAR